MTENLNTAASVLDIQNLKKHYISGSSFLGGETKTVYALDGVTLPVGQRETLSIAGESSCGKSTLDKVIMGLTPATQGQVGLNGRRIDNLSTNQLRSLRRDMQMVFQDPFTSLNPRTRVQNIIAEPIINFGLGSSKREIEEKVTVLLDQVRPPTDALKRYLHEFSGGQRHRARLGVRSQADRLRRSGICPGCLS